MPRDQGSPVARMAASEDAGRPLRRWCVGETEFRGRQAQKHVGATRAVKLVGLARQLAQPVEASDVGADLLQRGDLLLNGHRAVDERRTLRAFSAELLPECSLGPPADDDRDAILAPTS